jgi:amino acid transporter
MSSDETHLLQESQQADHENSGDEIAENNDDDAWKDPSLLVHGDDGQSSEPNSTLPRSLTYVNGLAIIISLQVGAGIFSAPAAVRSSVSTSTIGLLVWVLAGILMWAGAAAFIELGLRIPHNGGMQEYLRHCYGDLYGFVFAWVWILLSRPCAMAMVSLVFSEYLFKTVMPDRDVDVWILKGVALLAIAAVTLLNLIGTKTGATAANVFLVLKLFGLGTVAVAGLVFAVMALFHRGALFPPSTSEPGDSSVWAEVGGFTDAVLASLFAYGGCESVSADYAPARNIID